MLWRSSPGVISGSSERLHLSLSADERTAAEAEVSKVIEDHVHVKDSDKHTLQNAYVHTAQMDLHRPLHACASCGVRDPRLTYRSIGVEQLNDVFKMRDAAPAEHPNQMTIARRDALGTVELHGASADLRRVVSCYSFGDNLYHLHPELITAKACVPRVERTPTRAKGLVGCKLDVPYSLWDGPGWQASASALTGEITSFKGNRFRVSFYRRDNLRHPPEELSDPIELSWAQVMGEAPTRAGARCRFAGAALLCPKCNTMHDEGVIWRQSIAAGYDFGRLDRIPEKRCATCGERVRIGRLWPARSAACDACARVAELPLRGKTQSNRIRNGGSRDRCGPPGAPS